MPTKRSRTARNRREDFSNTLIHTATDGFWGDPNQLDRMEEFFNERLQGDRRAEVWLAIRDELLPEWINAKPGTRPTWWYLFDPDCPRISAEDIARCGWVDCWFAKDLPDLRRRVGGVGDPAFEHQNLVPQLHCAMPTHFVSQADVDYHKEEEDEDFHGKPIDPNDPPRYESQAAYLKRHNLLTTSEEHRLKARDFKPEVAGLFVSD